ncbi:MAG: hypothetical protein AAF550_00005, partial [Myxococcota bacterium]
MGASIGLAPLLFGGTFGWSVSVIAGISSMAAMTVPEAFFSRAGRHLPLLAVVWAVAVLFTLIQAIPLPNSLVAALAPESLERWLRAAHLLELEVEYAALSRDPGQTFAYFI